MTGPRKYRFTSIHTERCRPVPPAIVSLIKAVLRTVPQHCHPKPQGTAGNPVHACSNGAKGAGVPDRPTGAEPPSGRGCSAAVDVRRERTDEREVAVLLGVVQAVPDDELVR